MNTSTIPLCIGKSCEHYDERCDSNDGSGHCGMMRGLMDYEGGPLKTWMETYDGWVCVHKLLLRAEAQERCLAVAREEIKRSVELNCQLQTEVTCLEHAVDAARVEANNLRAATAVLIAQRDEAQRMYCNCWSYPADMALHHGWVGLYPETAKEPKKPDGWGRCTIDGKDAHADDDSPCPNFNDATIRCGDCPHFEPEEAKP